MAQAKGRKRTRQQFTGMMDELFPVEMFANWAVHGNALWTPRRVVWVSLIMCWLPGHTLQELFTAARKIVKYLQPGWKLPTSHHGFVDAQMQWGPVVWIALAARLRPDESFGEAWRVAGWLVLAVDGSRFECPRTTANERDLKCAGKEKTNPQIFQTTLQHVGTGLPWDIRLGPGTDSERRHLDDMLDDLPAQSLLTADAGFISFELCKWLIDNDHTFVLRVGGNITLLEGLGWEQESRGNVVYLWPQKYRSQKPLVLREIRFRSPGGLPVVLLTNEFDEECLTDDQVKEIYSSRWDIEVYYRSLKQTWGFSKLLSRTAGTCLNEQSWRLLSQWALQHVVVKILIDAGVNPRRYSPAQTRRIIRELLQEVLENETSEPLRKRLVKSVKDTYRRKGSKQTRNWPRKKQETPPQPPQKRLAKASEVRKAKLLGFLVRLNS